MTNAKLKHWIICRKCCNAFVNRATTNTIKCLFCGASIEARDRREERIKNSLQKNPKYLTQFAKHIKEDKESLRLQRKRTQQRLRKVILNLIGKRIIKCVLCGCDDERLLEINHTQGGGNKEMQKGKFSMKFYWNIYNGRRDTEDLELLCKICNARHYLESKYGSLPYEIKWDTNKK